MKNSTNSGWLALAVAAMLTVACGSLDAADFTRKLDRIESQAPAEALQGAGKLLQNRKCEGDVACRCRLLALQARLGAQGGDDGLLRSAAGRFQMSGCQHHRAMRPEVLSTLHDKGEGALAFSIVEDRFQRRPQDQEALEAYASLLEKDGRKGEADLARAFVRDVVTPVASFSASVDTRMPAPNTAEDWDKRAAVYRQKAAYLKTAREAAAKGRCRGLVELCLGHFDRMIAAENDAANGAAERARSLRDELERKRRQASSMSTLGGLFGALAGQASAAGLGEYSQVLSYAQQTADMMGSDAQAAAEELENRNNAFMEADYEVLVRALSALQ
ncbi:hypothetical protein [Pseudoxanthomonas mexicana]|uniref:hypothetical protein n=1 Tax=Pseudoxanthomonas mexicana TaxID=128785 RepID=UPI00398A5BDB